MQPWPCYRLVDAGVLTLTELHTVATREDVLLLNDLLDAKDEANDEQARKLSAATKRPA